MLKMYNKIKYVFCRVIFLPNNILEKKKTFE